LNVAEMQAGSSCRRIQGDRPQYLYVKADSARLPPGSYDAYVTVEYFDDRTNLIHLEYDKAPVERERNSFYTRADDLLLVAGSGQWRRAIVHLPEARFGHGQNFGADFRLCGSELAVRKIELGFVRPASYRSGGIDFAALGPLRTKAGVGMELDLGCDATVGEAALYRALGFTSVESYVTWQTVEDAGQGKWDWSRWDRQVEILEAAGLKWAPLLVAGPAYATPKWFRETPDSCGYVCLEHGEVSKIESLWNPRLRFWVDRFVKAFAERYRKRGVLELVRLGSTGTYGETLYPSGPNDGWTYLLPGGYHNHRGWWMGDRFAIESFRAAMRKRYGQIGALNQAWHAAHASFDAVGPMSPEQAPSPRAKLDVVNWYLESMTEFGAYWVATARKYFPDTPIYQSLGGAGEPVLGADFSAQARAFAPFGARLRVTNEASDYARNFAVTREVVSAAKAYGLDFGFEPAAHVSAQGNVARIYNTTASGGLHFFTYKGNILQDQASLAAYRGYASMLLMRHPRVSAALYLPKTSFALDERSLSRILVAAETLRGRLDFELLDRTTLTSPRMKDVKVLAVAEAPWAEKDEIEQLRRWVEEGGLLVARASPDLPLLHTPEGSAAESRELLANPPADVRLLRPKLTGPGPKHFRLIVGSAGDARYLWGDWYASEPGTMFPDVPDARMRWTGAKSGFHLPCDASRDATLSLTLNLLPRSLSGENRVLVNGAEVGKLDKSARGVVRFPVGKALLAGRDVAEVALEVRTFRPRDEGSSDTRELGAAVCVVELVSQGAEQVPAEQPPLAWEVDWMQANGCIRRIGRGATLLVPRSGPQEFGEVVVQALAHADRISPDLHGVSIPVTNDDGLFATMTDDGVLYYNSTDRPRTVGSLVVPAQGIASGP
jgi:hypothetical protein